MPKVITFGPTERQTPEVEEYKALSRSSDALYWPHAREGVRAAGAEGGSRELVQRGLCRSIINQRIGRLRRLFKWAASEELIPFEVYHRLATVAGLQRGRSKVRERTSRARPG